MKFCPSCGVENFEGSVYCVNCGQEFPSQTLKRDLQPTQTSSQSFQPTFPPSTSYGRPSPYVQPARVQYMNLIISPGYQYLINGSRAFAFGPIVSFVIGIVLVGDQSGLSSILGQLVNLIALALFAFGIYSISQLEPRTLNNRIKYVPILIILYAGLGFIISVLSESILTLPDDVSIEGLRSFTYQGIWIAVLLTGSAVIFLIGAHSFTQWYEEFITLLRAPHNITTNRIRWCALCQVIGSLLLLTTYLMFLSALDTLSLSTLGNAELVLALAAIVLFLAILFQVAGGYKVSTELNNIKMGKHDGTYQQHIIEKYR
jgi:hypothetical protein